MNIQDINTLDIFLGHHKTGFVPGVIEEFQGNEYHHAGIFVWCRDNVDGSVARLYVAEAIEHGPALTDFVEYTHSSEWDMLCLKPRFAFNNVTKDEMYHTILRNSGQSEYDYINLVWHQPWKFISKKIFGKELWMGKTGKLAARSLICGELVATYYNNFFPWLFKEPWKIAPVDIYRDMNFEHIKI